MRPLLVSSRTLEDDVPAEWDVGDVILDRYEVTALLGEGGMGKVYKVRHREWDLELAVKSPRASSMASLAIDTFVKEAQHWVRLGLHQHIVVCHYVRVLGGLPRVFTELVPGGNLAHWVHTGSLYAGTPEEALHRILDIAIQCAWGLQHAHQSGLVHQDVKTSNVMMMPDGTAKVSDFGLADFARVTLATGSVTATPSYASPEQMMGQPVGQPTDVWSWGLTVLEMFLRHWPSYGPNAMHELDEFLDKVTSDGLWMPEAVSNLLRWCFQERPEERPTVPVVAQTLLALYGTAYPRPRPGEVDQRADMLNNRAASMMDLGRLDDARRYLDDAVLADPWHLFACYNREVLRWRQGRITDEALLERMRELHTAPSDRWVVRYLTGCIQKERGDEDLAIEELMAAEREALGDPLAVQTVGRVRQQAQGGFHVVATLSGGAAALNAVAICGEGRVAAVDDDGMLHVWDFDSGRMIRSLRVHQGPIHDLVVSPDGLLLGTAGQDGTARLIDVASWRVISTMGGHKEPVRSVAVLAQGRLVATGGQGGSIRFFDKHGKLLRTQAAHDGAVTRLRFTESGGLLAAVSEDRRLTLWDVTHGDLVHDLAEHTGPIRGLALLSNQVITSSDDGSLRLWDVEAGSCHLVLHGHRAPVRDVAVTRDGRWAVSVSEDASMRLWEVKTGRCARTMRAGAGWLHGVALTDERALAAGSDMAVRVWHLAWDTPQTPPMVVRPRTSAELMDNRLQYLHWLEQVEEAWTSGHMDRALQALMAARQVPGYERAPRCLELWAAMLRNASRRRAQRAWLTASLTGHHGPITALSLDGSGHYLVSASEDATLRVFQLGTGECMMTLAGQQAAVRHMVLREDCERALTVGDDEDVLVWDVPGEQVIRRLAGHLRRVRGLCMTPDGRLAVTAGQEGRLRVWDVETGNCTANVQGLGEQVAITPDGRVLALATSGGRVRIYDVRAGKCMQVLRGHQGAVNQVVLTPDGRTAVSAGEDGTVQVFDLVRGRQKAVLKGHARSVLCVAVSCDGRHVVSGSRDRTLRVWNVDSPDEVPMRLAGHGGAVTAVCLNQDASHAVSGASDGVVRVWHLDWELETHPVAMWDERAEPCLSAFLCLEAARRPRQVRPLADRIWQDEDFSRLDHALSCWGFGWLNPDGVRQRLLQVAPAWPGPPELLKTSTHEDD